MKYLSTILLFTLFICGCGNEELFSEQSRHDLWLIHEGAKLPIVVEGNTLSKVFVILLHGGPGGSAQEFNASTKAFTDLLEEEYAVVYYDQRNAGLALGNWDEEKLTIEQHIEDLEQVIALLNFQFGDDINIFLTGHSWGGYLGTRFLLDPENQSQITAWININGLINRSLMMTHIMDRIKYIATEQIVNGMNEDSWLSILEQVESEKSKSISQYNVESEDNVFDLQRLANSQIFKDDVLVHNSNSVTASIYTDNYDPFRLIINGRRDDKLITQIYDSDEFVNSNLKNINIPSLSIYGYYDVLTPLQQGEYYNNKIKTDQADKSLVILNKSGHSSMRNQPIILAEEMTIWIEKYK